MESMSSPQLQAVGEINTTDPKVSYASLLQPNQKQATATISKLDLCPVSFVHGEPTIDFTIEQVNDFTREEGLHQAIVMKFSYGRPDLQEMRRLFSIQFDVQGNCNIGQLDHRHILVRFDLYTDYLQFLSKGTGYLKVKGDEFFFRTFPWTISFNPKEETTMSVVWISLPGLSPNFFAKKSLLSIAAAVGKPLAVDKATQERTRPSAARVKVLLDILDNHPTKIKLRVVDKSSGKAAVFYQEIVYDNMPKYCNHCKHQGHDETVCRLLKGNTGAEMNTTVDHNLTGSNANSVEKLHGDAREFLNTKRAAQDSVIEQLKGDSRVCLNAKKVTQNVVQIAEKHDNNTRQQGMQLVNTNAEATGSATKEGKSGTAAEAMVISTAQARSTTAVNTNKHQIDERIMHNVEDKNDTGIRIATTNQVHVHSVENRYDNTRGVSKDDIPTSNVFTRMNKGIGNGHNCSAQLLMSVEVPSSAQLLKNEEQQLSGKTQGQLAVQGDVKGMFNINKDKGGVKSKKAEDWTLVTSRNTITKKAASTGNLSPPVRRNPSGKVSRSNKFHILTPDKLEQHELAISNEVLMTKKLTTTDNKGQQIQGSDKLVENLVVRHNASEDNRLDEHSSNVPTLHFSSPQVEHIIKEAQNAMMRHTNMGRQPIVTLNTSDIEIPSQSEKSFDENEGHYIQWMQSTGNNNEVIPNLRELVSARQERYTKDWCTRGTFWSEQGHEEEESSGDDEDDESTDYNAMESENEETRSVASPQLPSNQKSNLNLNAPAFIPTKYTSATIETPGQNQQMHSNAILSIDANPVSHAQQQKLTTGQQHTSVVSAAIHGNDQPQHNHEAGQQLTQFKAQQQLIENTGQQQRLSIIPAISLEDRRLLDALHDDKTPDKSVATKAKEDGLKATTATLQTNRLGRDIYEQGEEEEILQTCMVEAAKKGDLSPMHSGKKLKSHSRKKSWDGKSNDGTMARQLPMRVAKQKQVASTISKTSNRSRNK